VQGIQQKAPSTDPAALIGAPVWRHFLTSGWAQATVSDWLPDKAKHTLLYNCGTGHEFQEEMHLLLPGEVLLSWHDPEALVHASPLPTTPGVMSVQLPAHTELSFEAASMQHPPAQVRVYFQCFLPTLVFCATCMLMR
jgi:hypothetical protein